MHPNSHPFLITTMRTKELPLLCVYYDQCDVTITRFAIIDDYKHWQESAFQYGVIWSYLMDQETGTFLECDYVDR